MHKLESDPEDATYKILWNLEVQTNHLNPSRRPDLVIINKKKPYLPILCCLDGAESENQRKRKEGIQLDLSRELRKSWNIRVTVILILLCALGTVSKVLKRGLEALETGGRIITIQTKVLSRSARILQKSPRYLRRFATIQTSSGRLSANTRLKNSLAILK